MPTECLTFNKSVYDYYAAFQQVPDNPYSAILHALNIPFNTGSVILLYLAVWGAYFLSIRAIGSIKALPKIHEKLKRFITYDE